MTTAEQWTHPAVAAWRNGSGHDLIAPEGADRVDRDALERDLKEAVSGEVRFDPGSRAIYAHDSSNYRQAPIGVVVPKTTDDVVAAVRVCHRARRRQRHAGKPLAMGAADLALLRGREAGHRQRDG